MTRKLRFVLSVLAIALCLYSPYGLGCWDESGNRIPCRQDPGGGGGGGGGSCTHCDQPTCGCPALGPGWHYCNFSCTCSVLQCTQSCSPCPN